MNRSTTEERTSKESLNCRFQNTRKIHCTVYSVTALSLSFFLFIPVNYGWNQWAANKEILSWLLNCGLQESSPNVGFDVWWVGGRDVVQNGDVCRLGRDGRYHLDFKNRRSDLIMLLFYCFYFIYTWFET